MLPNSAQCSAADQASGFRQSSRSRKMSAFAAMRLYGLSHNADVADAGLFHGVHHRRKCAERYVLITTQEDRLPRWVPHLLPQNPADRIDVDGRVAQKNPLL